MPETLAVACMLVAQRFTLWTIHQRSPTSGPHTNQLLTNSESSPAVLSCACACSLKLRLHPVDLSLVSCRLYLLYLVQLQPPYPHGIGHLSLCINLTELVLRLGSSLSIQAHRRPKVTRWTGCFSGGQPFLGSNIFIVVAGLRPIVRHDKQTKRELHEARTKPESSQP